MIEDCELTRSSPVDARPDIARVDGQIRHLPQHVVDVTRHPHPASSRLGPLLMAPWYTGERGTPRSPPPDVRGHLQLVAVLHRAPDLVNIEKSICGPPENRLSPSVTRHVAGCAVVAEQAALDPISPGRETQFRCGDGGSASLCGWQAQMTDSVG